jgi:hypothetical protein
MSRTSSGAGSKTLFRSHRSKSVVADQRGHGVGAAIDVYTKAAPSRRAEAAEQLEKAALTA